MRIVNLEQKLYVCAPAIMDFDNLKIWSRNFVTAELLSLLIRLVTI